jgi:hypothetical protein
MSLRTIRHGLFALLIAAAGFVAWTGHTSLPSAGGQGHPATHLVADGGAPGFPPPPS